MNNRPEPTAASAPAALIKAAVSPAKNAPDASPQCSTCTELAANRPEPGRLPDAMPASPWLRQARPLPPDLGADL